MNKYKSTLTIVIGFTLFSNYFDYKPLFIIAVIIGLISILSEKLNDKIISLWEKLTEALGLIMPNVILIIVFYFILTPLAYINKLNRKKNALQLKNTTNSTFITQRKEFSRESLEKIW